MGLRFTLAAFVLATLSLVAWWFLGSPGTMAPTLEPAKAAAVSPPDPTQPVTSIASTERTSVLAPAPNDGEAPVAQPSLVTDEPRLSAHVRGRLVDLAGEPVQGVEVLHRYWPGDSVTTESDQDGRFAATISWKVGPRTTWYELRTSKFGYAFLSHSASERLREGQSLDMGDLVLAPGGAAAGLVRLASGRSLVDTQIVAVEVTGDDLPPKPDAIEAGPEFGEVVVRGSVQDEGSFELVGVPTGRHAIWVKHPSTYLICPRSRYQSLCES